MIVVAGTRRSGTSMWMQILDGAGLPWIGEANPRDWLQGPLQAVNPAGFFESSLRGGINHTTNPDPPTGLYLHPHEVQRHAVKVFLPGLVRTDHAFLDRVVVTVRDWREVSVSLARLDALERGRGEPDPDAGPTLGPTLEWWAELWTALRDVLTRRYACHFVSYAAVLADPDTAIRETLGWIRTLPGEGPPMDDDAAVAAVQPDLYTRRTPGPPSSDLQPEWIAAFDALYQRIHRGEGLDRPFLETLQGVHQQLVPLIHELYREAVLHRRHASATEDEAP